MQTTTMRALHVAGALILQILTVTASLGQATEEWRDWNRPVEPFRVAGNIYYVGAKGIASYLITTEDGHILLDGGFPETPPIIRAGIAKLGFRLEDVKILLNSHAHFDHSGGLAELAEASGARVMISAADADVVESGGRTDFLLGDNESARFPPIKVDHRLQDREQVSLGGVTLTAHVTAGHTRGCTTWSAKVADDGRELDVVIVCSTTILPDYKLTGEPSYPGIAEDFAATFERLRSLPCDVFLAPHAGFFRMADKLKRRANGAETNPFIDPDGYRAYVERGDKRYRERLELELARVPE